MAKHYYSDTIGSGEINIDTTLWNRYFTIPKHSQKEPSLLYLIVFTGFRSIWYDYKTNPDFRFYYGIVPITGTIVGSLLALEIQWLI